MTKKEAMKQARKQVTIHKSKFGWVVGFVGMVDFHATREKAKQQRDSIVESLALEIQRDNK